MKECYEKAIKEVASLRESARNQRAASSENRKEVLESRRQVKRLNKDLLTMTAKEKAQEEASKCGYWSGGATVLVTMVYEAFRISGHWPGGGAWRAWWEHEALYGAICWFTTMTFASFHKAFHGK
tara:strand:+ start:1019 stop:1393 length:375 start_codon:yes stop_codon:yes gene_type:complete